MQRTISILSILFTWTFLSPAWSAQANLEQQSKQLVGAWTATITVTNPSGFPSFEDMFTFNKGGTFMESHPLYVPKHPVGPLMYTPGLGAWKSVGKNTYLLTFKFFAQGAPGNPTSEGKLIAINTVRYKLWLSDDGKKLRGNWSNDLTDLSGKVLISATGTMTAQRIKLEPPELKP